MGKKERLQRRVNRIDTRFKEKVRKGKKGTDTDIQEHEDRIEALAKKGGFTAPFMAKSPLKRRDKSNKEKRLSEKLETTQQDAADHYVEGHGEKNYNRKQDRLERKELRVEQKLEREQKKQSRKNLGLKGSGADRKGDRAERKALRTKQKERAARRKERESESPLNVDPFAKPKKKTINPSIAMMPSSAGKPVINAVKKGVKSVVDFYSGAKKQLKWPKK